MDSDVPGQLPGPGANSLYNYQGYSVWQARHDSLSAPEKSAIDSSYPGTGNISWPASLGPVTVTVTGLGGRDRGSGPAVAHCHPEAPGRPPRADSDPGSVEDAWPGVLTFTALANGGPRPTARVTVTARNNWQPTASSRRRGSLLQAAAAAA